MLRRCTLPLLLAVLLPLTFVVSACDSGGANEDTVNNEFSLTVTPASGATSAAVPKTAHDTTLSGFSAFYSGEVPNTGEQVFGVYFTDGPSFSQGDVQQGLFGLIARSGDRPVPGTYEIGNESGAAVSGILFENYGGFPQYVLESGTVTLEESSSERVAGRLNATATALLDASGSTASVRLSGSFTAKDIDTFLASPSGSPAP